jgi:hypothetical protein
MPNRLRPSRVIRPPDNNQSKKSLSLKAQIQMKNVYLGQGTFVACWVMHSMFLIEVEANTGNDTGIRMSKPALSFRVVSIAAGSILGKIADEHVMGAIVGNMRNSFIETKVKSSNVIGPLGRSASQRQEPGQADSSAKSAGGGLVPG